jgi:hypothetical protein
VIPAGFHVVFDDGDEADVPVGLTALDKVPNKDDAKPGRRVAALFGGGKYFPGSITKGADGNYDIQFDDGDTASVALTNLRLLAVEPVAGRTAKPGDKVWGQWRPNAWYPGKVSRLVPSGLHVVFDDGDEADLPVPLIAPDRSPGKNDPKVGSHVLALFTNGHFYPGTITAARDGTFDIRYDDGDTGTVKLSDMRMLNE